MVSDHLQALQKRNREGKDMQEEESSKRTKEWQETCMSLLQTLNKVSLVVDSNMPLPVLGCLEKIIVGLKRLPEYGIAPLIQLIEANIYTRITGEKVQY